MAMNSRALGASTQLGERAVARDVIAVIVRWCARAGAGDPPARPGSSLAPTVVATGLDSIAATGVHVGGHRAALLVELR